MPDANEMAHQLAALAESDPSGFARLSTALQATRQADNSKPPVRRATIYPPGEIVAMEIHTVDLKAWRDAGATDSLEAAVALKGLLDNGHRLEDLTEEAMAAAADALVVAGPPANSRPAGPATTGPTEESPADLAPPVDDEKEAYRQDLRERWKMANPGQKLHGRTSVATLERDLGIRK